MQGAGAHMLQSSSAAHAATQGQPSLCCMLTALAPPPPPPPPRPPALQHVGQQLHRPRCGGPPLWGFLGRGQRTGWSDGKGQALKLGCFVQTAARSTRRRMRLDLPACLAQRDALGGWLGSTRHVHPALRPPARSWGGARPSNPSGFHNPHPRPHPFIILLLPPPQATTAPSCACACC